MNSLIIGDIFKLLVLLLPLHLPFVQIVGDGPIRILDEWADVRMMFRFDGIRTPTDQQHFSLLPQI